MLVHLKEPQEAIRLHNYGLGNKVKADNQDLVDLVVPGKDCFWINRDSTKTERVASYEARKQRRLRRAQQSGGNVPFYHPVTEGEHSGAEEEEEA